MVKGMKGLLQADELKRGVLGGGGEGLELWEQKGAVAMYISPWGPKK